MSSHDDRTRARLERWGGYRPYEYLAPAPEIPQFEFAAVVGRVPEAAVAWPDEVERRAAELEAGTTVVSVHDHLSMRPADPARFAEYRRSGREHTPYEGIARSGVDLFFDGGPAAVSMIRSHTPFDWDDAVSDLAMRRADWSHQSLVRPIERLRDLEDTQPDQVGVVATLESATCIGNDLDRLDVLYGLGVRLLGVVYSESNQLGSGLAETGNGPLTALGRRAVRRMNELGMVVDVSHAGDQTCLDAVRASAAPVVVTHAGARALQPTPRMKPDDVIRAVADSGGYIGIEAAPNTTRARTVPGHDIDSVLAHLEYCLELVGPEHVALGPDTNFGDHLAWHRTFGPLFGREAVDPSLPPGPDDIPFVRGCENPAESTRNLIRGLVQRGYSDSEIQAVAGGNAMRVLSSVWAP
ncbi:dipeptidase [Nocardioides acrostichi]|uniref:Membrane dipeptidase n=1 Tax=Nocardioides acrostichi TaxID=2784339 RepID=A0A930V0I1_9ACTN|nr:membrane dipeptidase [Nocardioides acrostichi]MBF4163451.1 membrane dipeptidase [Nocardioides acrostichi]